MTRAAIGERSLRVKVTWAKSGCPFSVSTTATTPSWRPTRKLSRWATSWVRTTRDDWPMRESTVSKVEELDLRGNEIGPNGAKAIAALCSVAAVMTAIGEGGLNLKYNDLGDEGWGAIFTGVCSNKDSKISSIDVSNESIGLPGAKLIAEALA